MAKISVIIPVYNTAKYLDMCLDSVIDQTFTDIEIICVNDGSTDNSADVLQAYSNFDDRIKIITQENKGLSAARNKGLETAIGEFITFVDSDDRISPVMLEHLYKNMQKTQSDLALCELYGETNTASELFEWEAVAKYELKKDLKKTVFCENESNPQLFFNLPVMAYAKMYKKSFLDFHGFRFQEGLIFEDTPFFADVYLNAKKISYVAERLYIYRSQRDGSIVSSGKKNFFDMFEIHRIMEDIFKKNNKFEKYKQHIFIKRYSDLVWCFNLIDNSLKKEFFDKINSEYKDLNLNGYNTEILYKDNRFVIFKKMLELDYKGFLKYLVGLRKYG